LTTGRSRTKRNVSLMSIADNIKRSKIIEIVKTRRQDNLQLIFSNLLQFPMDDGIVVDKWLLWTYNSKSWVMFPILVGWIHLKCYKSDQKDILGGRNLEFHQLIMWKTELFLKLVRLSWLCGRSFMVVSKTCKQMWIGQYLNLSISKKYYPIPIYGRYLNKRLLEAVVSLIPLLNNIVELKTSMWS